MVELFTYVDTPWGPSVRDAGPALLAELLPLYEAEIFARIPEPASHFLRPGTPRGDTTKLLNEAGLGAPEELLMWFEWSAGASPSTPGRPYPFIDPVSAERAVASYTSLREGDAEAAIQLPELTEEERGWGVPAGWLRLERENFSIAMFCGGAPRDPAPMRYATPFFGTTEAFGSSQFLSLSTLIAWSIDALRSGAAWWSGHRWECDLDKLPASQIAAGIVG